MCLTLVFVMGLDFACHSVCLHAQSSLSYGSVRPLSLNIVLVHRHRGRIDALMERMSVSASVGVTYQTS